jgi:urease accessory protein
METLPVLQARSWLPRTEGALRLAFAARDGRTALAGLHQAGALRARFPSPAAGAPPEAVLLNTAGGLTGGDRMDLAVALAAGTQATLTTAAAEKIYRAGDGDAAIRVRLALGAGARLDWLPQPTILFDRSRLERTTEVEMAAGASLLAVEMLVFGRMAMGEDVHRGAVRDAWRVRRAGALVYADTFRADGAVAGALDRPGTLAGARAAAMLLYVAPDAEGRLEAVRAMLQDAPGAAGASAWNGLLAVRAVARDGAALQRLVAPLVPMLSGRPLPRVWSC